MASRVAYVVSVETRVPLERAWSWWTDFGPVGAESVEDHGMGKSLRVVRERAGNRIVLEERLLLPGRPLAFRHTVEVDAAARCLLEEAPTYRSTWRFEALPGAEAGTRITREVEPRGVGKLAVDALMRRIAERDLRTHVRTMEADVGGGRAVPG